MARCRDDGSNDKEPSVRSRFEREIENRGAACDFRRADPEGSEAASIEEVFLEIVFRAAEGVVPDA